MTNLQTRTLALLLLLSVPPALSRSAKSKGPPRGWRSWIAFGRDADQTKMQAAIKSLHKPRPLGAGGALVSLQDLGYGDVALDGGWARCEGVNGSYHDESGQLLINETKFPSFKAMNSLAHSHALTSSWYLNCDQCTSTEKLIESPITEAWYTNDANLLAQLDFDGVKFDTQPGGPNWNITKWSMAMNATGKPIVIEDCLDKHPDGTPLKKSTHPSIDILHHPEDCPFQFYRTSGDNYPTFERGMSNTLISTEPFLNKTTPVPASRPGCWAYPDMLSIGKSNMQQNWLERGCPLLNIDEERTLFATWAILSSPLILSFDITNDTEVERLWPIIANKRALSINEQWAGEAGRVLKRAGTTVNATECWKSNSIVTFPSWVVWSKRLSEPANSLAVLAINIGETAQTFSVAYEELLNAGAGGETNPAELMGKDVWSGRVSQHLRRGQSWEVHLPKAHDSTFLVFSATERSSRIEEMAVV